jgi:pectate lyase
MGAGVVWRLLLTDRMRWFAIMLVTFVTSTTSASPYDVGWVTVWLGGGAPVQPSGRLGERLQRESCWNVCTLSSRTVVGGGIGRWGAELQLVNNPLTDTMATDERDRYRHAARVGPMIRYTALRAYGFDLSVRAGLQLGALVGIAETTSSPDPYCPVSREGACDPIKKTYDPENYFMIGVPLGATARFGGRVDGVFLGLFADFDYTLTRVSFPGDARTGALAEVKAFPTAEGFGAQSVGGRGGRVIAVTTLADSGPGSLRDAIAASGPRIIVFRVGGVIALDTALDLSNPYVTMAGQTAPGDGIVITGNSLHIDSAHDVIVRHLRVRPADNPAKRMQNDDALSIAGTGVAPTHDVIVDHLSASWSTDDVLSVYGSSSAGVRNVTVQWCVIAEGLHCDYLSGNCAASGSIVGYGSQNVTVHHSLWAHQDHRSPEVAGGTGCTDCDVVNNTMYNWGSRASSLGNGSTANYVRNMYIRGSASGPLGSEMHVLDDGFAFLDGNATDGTVVDQWLLTRDGAGSPAQTTYRSLSRFAAPPIIEQEVFDAHARVLGNAGATKPRRDATDQRVIDSVVNRTGTLVNRIFPQTAGDSPNPGPSDIPEGTFPTYSGGTAYPDADGDGMDDAWESAHGLDPTDPSDGPQVARNGYTHVENFINELAGDPPARY